MSSMKAPPLPAKNYSPPGFLLELNLVVFVDFFSAIFEALLFIATARI